MLQRLAAWREGEARRRDLPRSFVAKEELLLAVATRLPATVGEIERLPGAERRQVERYGGLWLDLLAEVRLMSEEELPPRLQSKPPTAALRALEERLRESVRQRAEALGIAPEVLAPRRLWGPLLRSASDGEARLPPELAGWRRSVIGEELLRQATSG